MLTAEAKAARLAGRQTVAKAPSCPAPPMETMQRTPLLWAAVIRVFPLVPALVKVLLVLGW